MIFEGTVAVTLEKPFNWEGRKIETVSLDFGKLNARIMIRAERDTFNSGNMSTILRNLSDAY